MNPELDTPKFFEDNLKEMFERRDGIHKTITLKINLQLQFMYDAIVEFFKESPEQFDWVSVHLNDKDVLVVVGRIVVDPKENLFRVVTVGIPMDIIAKQSRQDVLVFLHNANEEFKKRVDEEEQLAKELITQQVRRALQENHLIEHPVTNESEDVPITLTTAKRVLH
jgi:hypothetical protein